MTATVVAQSHLKPDLIDAIETSLRVNASWAAAADYAGIGDRLLRSYRERAERYQRLIDTETEPAELAALEAHPDRPYWEAHQRWLTARSRGELELVATIRKVALTGDWRAAQALLKVGWPDRYSERVEITGAGGGPLELTIEERTAAILESARVHRQRCAKKPKQTKTKEPAQ